MQTFPLFSPLRRHTTSKEVRADPNSEVHWWMPLCTGSLELYALWPSRTKKDVPRRSLPWSHQGKELMYLHSTLWSQEMGVTLAIHEQKDLISTQAAAGCQLCYSTAGVLPHSPVQRFCGFIPGSYNTGEGTQQHTSPTPKMSRNRTEHKFVPISFQGGRKECLIKYLRATDGKICAIP